MRRPPPKALSQRRLLCVAAACAQLPAGARAQDCTVAGLAGVDNGVLGAACQPFQTLTDGTSCSIACLTGYTLSGVQPSCASGVFDPGSIMCVVPPDEHGQDCSLVDCAVPLETYTPVLVAVWELCCQDSTEPVPPDACAAWEFISVAATASEDVVCTAHSLASCRAGFQPIPSVLAGTATADCTDEAGCCEACPAGTWTAAADAAACIDHSACGAWHYISTAGTPSGDVLCTAHSLASCPTTGMVPIPNVLAGTATADCTDEAGCCEACPAGTFANADDWLFWGLGETGLCAVHSVCAAGQYISTAGTATADVVCSDCPMGTFSIDHFIEACAPDEHNQDCMAPPPPTPSDCTMCPVGCTYMDVHSDCSFYCPMECMADCSMYDDYTGPCAPDLTGRRTSWFGTSRSPSPARAPRPATSTPSAPSWARKVPSSL